MISNYLLERKFLDIEHESCFVWMFRDIFSKNADDSMIWFLQDDKHRWHHDKAFGGAEWY